MQWGYNRLKFIEETFNIEQNSYNIKLFTSKIVKSVYLDSAQNDDRDGTKETGKKMKTGDELN